MSKKLFKYEDDTLVIWVSASNYKEAYHLVKDKLKEKGFFEFLDIKEVLLGVEEIKISDNSQVLDWHIKEKELINN